MKDAPRILGRLRTVFPVEPSGLVVGPTVEINWGTPAIVTGRFAMLAQFAGAFGGGDFRFTRLTILGTVRATAPPLDVDAPRLVELTADVLGDYDYESGLIAIDARLRDSKLGGVEFSGSLLIRIGTAATCRPSPSPRVGSIRRSPTCRRRCPPGSTGSRCGGRSAAA